MPTFVNPFMLWGLLAAAIPVLIHLLNRRRYQRQRWAAMEWLLKAAKENQRRFQLENLLLLLLRTLAVIFLALALSRPFLSAAPLDLTGSTQAHLFLVIDNSASMSARSGTRTALEDAVQSANGLLAELGGADPVTVVVTNDNLGSAGRNTGRPTVARDATTDHAEIRSFLASLATANTGASLAEALQALESKVVDSNMPARRVAILTDLQRVTIDGDTGSTRPEEDADTTMTAALERLRDAGASVVVVPSGRPVPNVAITRLAPRDDRDIVQGSPIVFEAQVTNFSDRRERVEVRFLVDGEERGAGTTQWVELPGRAAGPGRAPSSSTEVEIVFGPDDIGAHLLEATATADGMSVDDTRTYAFRVRKPIRVLAVDGDPTPRAEGARAETHFLVGALALREEGPIEVVRITDDELASAELDDVDLVVLANVARLGADALRERLEQFVADGGSVFFTVGDRVVPDVWNREFHRDGDGLLPARLRSAVYDEELPTEFDLGESRHPILRDVTDPAAAALFRSPHLYGYMRVDEIEESGGRTVLSYTDLDVSPALIEKRFGDGRTLLLTTTVDEAWGEFPGSYVYLALLHEAVYHLASQGNQERNLLTYEPFLRTLEGKIRNFEVLYPDGSPAGVQVERPADAPAYVEFTDTEQLGGYPTTTFFGADDILGSAPPPELDVFSVAMPSLESDTRRIPTDELAARWDGLANVADSFEESEGAVTADASTPLHRHLLVLALLCLLGEVIVSRRIGARRSRRS